MKKLTRIGWLILIAALIVACQPSVARIKPGDKIGGMNFLKDCTAPDILFDLCTLKELDKGTCEVPAYQTAFRVSAGWTDGSWESMNLTWKDSEWTMTFDGKEIDLPSFGFDDSDWKDPDGKTWKARVWDVCVTNAAPGKHTVVYEFLFRNGVWRGNHEVTFNFTVLAP